MILRRKEITNEIIFAKDQIITKWHGHSRKHYESLGYKYTKPGDEFAISPCQLTPGSNRRELFVCPNCENTRLVQVRGVYKAGHSFCKKCVKTILFMDDITGNVYSRLTVIRNTGMVSAGETYLWECRCECGNTVVTTGTSLKSGHTKSCGCIRIINKGKRSNTEADKKWRHLVFKRDRGKCFLCHKRDRVNAHHLFSYAAYPDAQYDVNNGITICFDQHHEFHKKYGYRKTSPNQIIDFMNGRYYKSAKDLNSLYNL